LVASAPQSCAEHAGSPIAGADERSQLAYAGRAEMRPTLGDGRAPDSADIERAARLSTAVGAAAALLATAVRAAIARRRP